MDSILMPTEIDMYVETMVPQKIDNIGMPQWLDWHQRLQKLNQEALVEASTVKEEHVKESLVAFGKVTVLIHEAILINIWKYKVLPHLLKLEPNPDNTFIAYSVLYHEAVCVALMELSLFHSNCTESLEDSACDLLEYLSGCVSQLLSVKQKDPDTKETAQEELMRHRDNLSFDIGMKALSIIRYMAETSDRLPLSVLTSMYSTYDIPVLYTELLLTSPWVNDGKVYSAGRWRVWDNEALSQVEAQVWLTLRHLLLDPESNTHYPLTESRKTQFLKLLPIIRPSLLDQLSPVMELKQWLCRLSFSSQPSAPPRPILLEPVLEIKQKILKQSGGKWKDIAAKQRPVIFNSDRESLQETAKMLSEAYNTELLEKLEVKEKATCSQCGKGAIQRCSRCKKSWYCSRACQVTHWPQHKDECESTGS